MKKRNILRRILAVVLVLTMATGLTAQAKGDASSTSLKEAQKEKAALEKQLKAAKELINDLKDSKGDVEDKVQELNNELVDISSKITSLENQLADVFCAEIGVGGCLIHILPNSFHNVNLNNNNMLL